MSMVLIQRQVLSSSAASVTFSNIPQNFKTLRLLVSARTDRGATDDTLSIYFNGSTSNFSYRELYGNGSSAFSGSGSVGRVALPAAANNTSNTFGNAEVWIPNYSGSSNKPVLADSVSENNATTAYQIMYATLWSNTAAITSLSLQSIFSSNLVANSTFSLYGLI